MVLAAAGALADLNDCADDPFTPSAQIRTNSIKRLRSFQPSQYSSTY